MNSVPLLFPLPATVYKVLVNPQPEKNFPFISPTWLEQQLRWSPRSQCSGFLWEFLQCSARSLVPEPAAKYQKERQQLREQVRSLHFELRCHILWKYLLRSMAAQLTARVTGSGSRMTVIFTRGWLMHAHECWGAARLAAEWDRCPTPLTHSCGIGECMSCNTRMLVSPENTRNLLLIRILSDVYSISVRQWPWNNCGFGLWRNTRL